MLFCGEHQRQLITARNERSCEWVSKIFLFFLDCHRMGFVSHGILCLPVQYYHAFYIGLNKFKWRLSHLMLTVIWNQIVPSLPATVALVEYTGTKSGTAGGPSRSPQWSPKVQYPVIVPQKTCLSPGSSRTLIIPVHKPSIAPMRLGYLCHQK